MNIHPVVTVTVGGLSADVDEMLAPLVEALWRNGIATFTSCQDAGESNRSWIEKLPHMAEYVNRHAGWSFVDFPVDQALDFLDIVARSGPRDAFYVRMAHWAAPGAWRVNARPMDRVLRDEALSSEFELRLMQVMFPQADIAEITRRLNAHLAGQLVDPAPVDWSTVGR